MPRADTRRLRPRVFSLTTRTFCRQEWFFRSAVLALVSALVFLLLLQSIAAFEFTELMPNPTGDDNNKEFVELFTNNSFLLNETYIIADETSNDTLQHLASFGNASPSFLLIVEEGYELAFNESDFENYSCHIFSAGATIGNNLANTGEELTFIFGNKSLHTNYSVFGCAEGEGCSLQRRNASWSAENATPCGFPPMRKNVVQNTTINDTQNSTQNTTLIKTDPGPCLINFSIESDTLFTAGDTISYTPIIESNHESFSFEITYWWEDLFGTIVKEARTTTNDDTKRYTPKLVEHEKDGALIAKMTLVTNCTEQTFAAEKLVVLQGEEDATCPEQEEQTCSNSNGGGAGLCPKYETLAIVAPEKTTGNFFLAVTLTNELIPNTYRVYAYVYRGSKAYSGAREANAADITLEKDEQKTLLLPLHFEEGEPGEYSIKAIAERAGRKTPFEARTKIELTQKNTRANTRAQTELLSAPQEKTTEPEKPSNLISGQVIADENKDNIFFSAWPAVLVAGALYGLSRFLSRRKVYKDSPSLKDYVRTQEKEGRAKEKSGKKSKEKGRKAKKRGVR